MSSFIHTIETIKRVMPKESRLTPIEIFRNYSINSKPFKMVKCLCACGNTTNVFVANMKATVSCGCTRKRANVTVIGADNFSRYSHNLMQTYHNMISRCYNPKNKAYPSYGGRGVVVCDEWRNSFDSFIKWALENGWKQGLHLDKDIIGNGMIYSPGTCKFVTSKENNNNRRGNIKFDYKGALLTVKQISEAENISDRIIYHRLKRGWSIGDAIVPTTQQSIKIFISNLCSAVVPEMKTEEYKIVALKAINIIKEIKALFNVY